MNVLQRLLVAAVMVAVAAGGLVLVFRSPKCISGPSIRPAEAIMNDNARTLAEARAVEAEDRRVEVEAQNGILRQQYASIHADVEAKARLWNLERSNLLVALNKVATERDAAQAEAQVSATRADKLKDENAALDAKLKKKKCWLF